MSPEFAASPVAFALIAFITVVMSVAVSYAGFGLAPVKGR